LNNDELEEEQMPMSIGDEISFADAISPAVNAAIIITNTPQDEKSLMTGQQLVNSLRIAGWNFSFPSNRPPAGILIKFNVNPTNDNDPATVAAHLLHAVLAKRNVPVQLDFLTNSPDIPPETVVLQIGLRPTPPLYEKMVISAKIYDAIRDITEAMENPKTKRKDLKQPWQNLIELLTQEINLDATQDKKTIPLKGSITIFDDNLYVTFSDGQPVFALTSDGETGFILTNGVPTGTVIAGKTWPMPNFDK